MTDEEKLDRLRKQAVDSVLNIKQGLEEIDRMVIAARHVFRQRFDDFQDFRQEADQFYLDFTDGTTQQFSVPDFKKKVIQDKMPFTDYLKTVERKPRYGGH